MGFWSPHTHKHNNDDEDDDDDDDDDDTIVINKYSVAQTPFIQKIAFSPLVPLGTYSESLMSIHV